MKKRPPPGATLISRLKEGRLRREQSLIDRGLKEPPESKEESIEETASDTPAASTQSMQDRSAVTRAKTVDNASGSAVNEESKPGVPKIRLPGPRNTSPVVSAASGNRAAESAGSTSGADITVRASMPAAASKLTHDSPSTAKKSSPAAARTDSVDFIRRSISIEDLRPVSDEYDLLTEEIRLAGRFAAAGLIAQGLRLCRLKDDQIYKDHYTTFEDYCQQEHSMTATYAYRLIRMAEMAERLATEGAKPISSKMTDSMPDPFEVMLGLGHRHLLALLPLETQTAEELLTKGIPVAGDSGKSVARIPIVRATEQQIREAIKSILPQVEEVVRRKTSTVPASRSVRSLEDIVELLQEWADWLESEPDNRFLTDRIGEGQELGRLKRKFRTVSERFMEALSNTHPGSS